MKLHVAKKHTTHQNESSKITTVSPQELTMLLKKTLQKIIFQDMYPEDILLEVNNLQDKVSTNDKFIEKLYTDVCKKINFKNTESFYISFYNTIVRESTGYFHQVANKCATIVTRKLGDELMKFVTTKRNPEVEEIVTKNLSEKEVSALQYLGGYVLHNLYRKCRNSSKYKDNAHQEIMSLLLAGRTDSNPNSKLVEALSRGGLWFIDGNIERIFVITEKYFCIKSMNHHNKITVFDMVKNLMEFPQIQTIFKLVVDSSDIEISKEVSKSTLYGMLTLYIRVRSFSFAKDTVEKHKIKMNSKLKDARIRKQLKNMNNGLESLQ